MQLSEFVEHYLTIRPTCEQYAKTIRNRTKRLGEFAGRTELSAVFNETTVNSFLAQLHGLSPFTRNKYRQDFLAVWRAAADEDYVGYPQARRLRRERIVAKVIECYQENEARSLVVAAQHLTGGYSNGVARRHYWPAAIRAAWDSGLRRGDVWTLKSAMIRRDGTAVIVQHKTGSPVTIRLHKSTVRAMNVAGGSLQWPQCEWCFRAHFEEIVQLSGLRKGSFKWLRRGSGSTVDAHHPGQGHKHLGNGRQVFEKHYDAKLGESKKPLPPEL